MPPRSGYNRVAVMFSAAFPQGSQMVAGGRRAAAHLRNTHAHTCDAPAGSADQYAPPSGPAFDFANRSGGIRCVQTTGYLLRPLRGPWAAGTFWSLVGFGGANATTSRTRSMHRIPQGAQIDARPRRGRRLISRIVPVVFATLKPPATFWGRVAAHGPPERLQPSLVWRGEAPAICLAQANGLGMAIAASDP